MNINMDNEWIFFKEKADEAGTPLTEQQLSQFMIFYECLIEKNKVMNLTAITELHDVIIKHFLDSLALSRVCSLSQEDRVLDMGTGAGFPGIPLKIMYPDTEFVLADSLNKRILFLEEVIRGCSLKKIEAVHSRAEDLARDKSYRDSFSVCVSRAVASLPVLSEYCLPFVKTGGCFISYKSGNIDMEIEQSEHALKTLRGKTERCEKFTLPDTDAERSLVVIRKTGATPAAYPRKAGMPSKQPL